MTNFIKNNKRQWFCLNKTWTILIKYKRRITTSFKIKLILVYLVGRYNKTFLKINNVWWEWETKFQDAIENKKINYFYSHYFQNDPLSKLLARVRHNIYLVDNLAPPNKICKQQRFAQGMWKHISPKQRLV